MLQTCLSWKVCAQERLAQNTTGTPVAATQGQPDLGINHKKLWLLEEIFQKKTARKTKICLCTRTSCQRQIAGFAIVITKDGPIGEDWVKGILETPLNL